MSYLTKFRELLPNLTVNINENTFQIGLRLYSYVEGIEKEQQVENMCKAIYQAVLNVEGKSNKVLFREEVGETEKVTFISFTKEDCCVDELVPHTHPVIFSLKTPKETPETDIHVDLYMIVFKECLITKPLAN